jgi:hypothetical protein
LVENHIFAKAVILKAAEKADFPAVEMIEVRTNIEVKMFLDDWILERESVSIGAGQIILEIFSFLQADL